MLPVGIELFSYVTKNLLLQDICIAADHVSDNDPNVKDMNNWGANLFFKFNQNALPPPPPPHPLCTLCKHHLQSRTKHSR